MQWCKCANETRLFENGRPEDLKWIEAAKLVCTIENHRGFCSGGVNIYFIPGTITEESCESQLEEGRTKKVYTYWKSTSGEWQFYKKWYKPTPTDKPFKLTSVSREAADAAAKLICEFMGYPGFSFGGKNFFFIPERFSAIACEDALEAGVHNSVYTMLRSGSVSTQVDLSPVEEYDWPMITND